jgi:hypothetical protein
MNKKFLILGVIILLAVATATILFFISEQKQSAIPKTYSEIFQNPIDPSSEPEKHKEVYEKAKKVVDFRIFYPQGTINGYKLTDIQARKDLAFETKGFFTTIYEKDGSKIKVVEGIADIGMVKSLEYIDIANQESGKKAWLWEQGDKIGISLYYNSEANYFLVGENTTKEDLVQFAEAFSLLK